MIFLGRDLGEQKDYSEHDGESRSSLTRSLLSLDEGYARATAILREHRDLLDRLAKELLGKESLDAGALEAIFQAA